MVCRQNSYILSNDGKGNFSDVSQLVAPGSKNRHDNRCHWDDMDGDSDPDLLLVGEYIPVTMLLNESGKFTE